MANRGHYLPFNAYEFSSFIKPQSVLSLPLIPITGTNVTLMQAPAPIGQAPAPIGQAPAPIGQAPAPRVVETKGASAYTGAVYCSSETNSENVSPDWIKFALEDGFESFIEQLNRKQIKTLDLSSIHKIEHLTHGKWGEIMNQYKWDSVHTIILNFTDIREFNLQREKFPSVDNIKLAYCKQLKYLDLRSWKEIESLSLNKSAVEELYTPAITSDLYAGETPLRYAEIMLHQSTKYIMLSKLVPNEHKKNTIKFIPAQETDVVKNCNKISLWAKDRNVHYTVTSTINIEKLLGLTINLKQIIGLNNFVSTIDFLRDIDIKYHEFPIRIDTDIPKNLRFQALYLNLPPVDLEGGSVVIPSIPSLKRIYLTGQVGKIGKYKIFFKPTHHTLNVKLRKGKFNLYISSSSFKYNFVKSAFSPEKTSIKFKHIPESMELSKISDDEFAVVPNNPK